MIKYLPNIITIFRIIAIPFIIYSISQHHYNTALKLFILASVSDALDGALARRFHARSKLGSYLDPLADKLLIWSTYSSLVWIGFVPLWVLGLIAIRDICILVGFYFFYVGRLASIPRPTWLGKINAAYQLIYVIIILVFGGGLSSVWHDMMAYGLGGLTLASGAQYLIITIRGRPLRKWKIKLK